MGEKLKEWLTVGQFAPSKMVTTSRLVITYPRRLSALAILR